MNKKEIEFEKYVEFASKYETNFYDRNIYCENCNGYFSEDSWCIVCECEINADTQAEKYCLEKGCEQHICSEECLKEYYDEKVVKNDKF